MAGFFGLFNFTKPGKGVDVNAPPKKPFIRFFELYWRKFSRLLLMNLLVFFLLLPIITVVFRFFFFWIVNKDPENMNQILSQAGEAAASVEGEVSAPLISVFQDILLSLPVSFPFIAPSTFPEIVFLILLIASLILYGPVMCGYAYMLRNYAREEHAWFSDFFLRMKKNFRQGVALGLLELFSLSMLIYNLNIQPAEGNTIPVMLVKLFSPLLLVVILFMRKYMYVMTVTFDLSLFNVIKNSLVFSVVGLPRNFLVLLIEAVIIFAVFFLPVFDILLMPFFFFSLTGFLSVFAAYPLIHKHMILPIVESKKESD